MVQSVKQGYKRLALITKQHSDIEEVFIDGPSGFQWWPKSYKDIHGKDMSIKSISKASPAKVTLKNGARISLFSAENPDKFRGPGIQILYCDEIAAWRRAKKTWDTVIFAVREPPQTKIVVASTPKPLKIIKDLLERGDIKITRGSLYENIDNLSPDFIENIKVYEGTDWGQQEIHGVLLEEYEGALWTRKLLEKTRVSAMPTLKKKCIGLDPVGSHKSSDKAGIVSCGLGEDDHLYFYKNLSRKASPEEWAKLTLVEAVDDNMNAIVVERNMGGDMAKTILMNEAQFNTGYSTLPIPIVEAHAKVGKTTRAEPIAQLFQQEVAHIVGRLPELEDQMCTYTEESDYSPDDLDAAVYAGYFLAKLRRQPKFEKLPDIASLIG